MTESNTPRDPVDELYWALGIDPPDWPTPEVPESREVVIQVALNEAERVGFIRKVPTPPGEDQVYVRTDKPAPEGFAERYEVVYGKVTEDPGEVP